MEKYHRKVFDGTHILALLKNSIDGTDMKEEDGKWQPSEGGRKSSWKQRVQRDRRWFV
jgi:hypothetical protein